MNKFKLLLGLVIVVASGVIAAAKFLLTEVHVFWLFLTHLQW
jgi:hypothetical protein